MNQEHFLIELKIYLRALPTHQQEYILSTFVAKFSEGIALGKSEEQIAKELGNPQKIATKILNEFDIPIQESPKQKSDWEEFHEYGSEDFQTEINPHPYDPYQDQAYLRQKPSFFVRLCQVLGIISLNLFFMVWIIFSIFLVLFSVWAVTVVCLFSPFLGIYVLFTDAAVLGIFQFFCSLLLCGISIFAIYVLGIITRFFFRLFRAYFRWCIAKLQGDTR